MGRRKETVKNIVCKFMVPNEYCTNTGRVKLTDISKLFGELVPTEMIALHMKLEMWETMTLIKGGGHYPCVALLVSYADTDPVSKIVPNKDRMINSAKGLSPKQHIALEFFWKCAEKLDIRIASTIDIVETGEQFMLSYTIPL